MNHAFAKEAPRQVNSRRAEAFIAAIGTFAPQPYHQEELLRHAECDDDDFAKAISQSSAIEFRCFNELPSNYRSANMADRRAYHERASVGMALSALRDAAATGLDLSRLDAVITVNSTGFMMPGVAEMLGEMHNVGRRGALRFNLVGHGCVGAIPGLQLANSLVKSGQARTAAVVCTEPLLHLFNPASRDRPSLVPRVLFGEGAAAMIVADRDLSEGRLPAIVDSEVLLANDSLGHIVLKHEDEWLCSIDRRVPEVGGDIVMRAMGELLGRHGLTARGVEHWAFHTGGRKVLDTCQAGFGLTEGAMRPSREVLRRYGNVQSASVIFSMKELLGHSRPKAGDLGSMVAIGPGMLAGGILLEWR